MATKFLPYYFPVLHGLGRQVYLHGIAPELRGGALPQRVVAISLIAQVAAVIVAIAHITGNTKKRQVRSSYATSRFL